MEAPQKTKMKIEDDRTGIDNETLKRAFLDNLFYIQGKNPQNATRNDYYMALAYTVRDRLLHRWLFTQKNYHEKNVRTVGYLSAEYLMGPHLGNNLINLGLYEKVKKSISELGLDLKYLLDQEEEPGLGNGGLGRLAACYLDSMATQDVPAIGYGIRYEFGIFDQIIQDGWQVEITDKWLRYGNPWEIPRIEDKEIVGFGGKTESYYDDKGTFCVKWIPEQVVVGIPYDTPILGFGTNTAATLRLWNAQSAESFDFQSFNRGDYYGAVYDKIGSETISKILYPNDSSLKGKELRLKQQYFFVSCSLQDVIKLHLTRGNNIKNLCEKFALQLNDTHPSIAVAELMRLLVDEHHLDWGQAWDITQKTLGYTNHTLLPEALETWSVGLMQWLLPRHMEIIYEINFRFLEIIKAKYPGDDERQSRMSIINENGEKSVRMANLAIVGSHSVNGVAALHTDLLKKYLFHDFYALWPEKFSNKTNGVTPRRWMVLINPKLSELISETIGTGWIRRLDELKKLEAYAENPNFVIAWQKCKRSVKKELSDYVKKEMGIHLPVDSLYDMQAKRIHEYKRQHLNALHIITLYNRLKANPDMKMVPRVFVFGGKAAPGYMTAKLIIKLITSIGDKVNNDPDVRDRLKVVFMPDFNVTNSQRIYPAADLSEQISTAGLEASGTGNMKFAMNGALTIGTLDGANIEIREEVGEANFFLFGLTTPEVSELRKNYQPRDYYDSNIELKKCLDMISTGYFSPDQKNRFWPLVDHLLEHDDYMLLADYDSYIQTQELVSAAYSDSENWAKMSILNVARIGKFSSDRSIAEYSKDIWKIEPVKIEIPEYNAMTATEVELEMI
ncbi:MAG: starch phosphorylase [Cyclobacteriaceae bacterium]|jgi:starch phosphorylase